ncbi:hypothetical protein RRF57_009845 [Xylaria bambusicola]|uniref:Uncharacterized protein n=1 Tax=Xylaria bambusicola TaxID=326684 RepID=A0AAN7ZCB0_9PEZI
MLTANSPSTLDGIIYDGANTVVPDKYEMSFLRSRIQKAKTYKPIAMIFRLIEGYNPVELAFEGRSRTVKLWKHGLNKRQWVQEAVNDYEASMTMHRLGKGIGPVKLRRQLTLNAQDCAYVAVSSLFLILAPTALALLFVVPYAVGKSFCKFLQLPIFVALILLFFIHYVDVLRSVELWREEQHRPLIRQ